MKLTHHLLPLIVALQLFFTSHQYEVEEHWFHTRVDHFNYQPTTPSTFPLRYCVNDHSWNPHNGSVLFYSGNEADIYQFVNNTGIIFEIAHEFNSLVVFAEHRYYGLSQPFGPKYSLTQGYNISFLTVEQAMQDFNTLNLHIRQKWNMDMSTPFVVFGGSYGGNLAMWLRLKQPNLWAGAIASSVTPLKHLLRETNGFHRIETEVYANVSDDCPDLVRSGWKELYDYSSTTSGQTQVVNALSLCTSFDDEENSANAIYGWISSALETMVQYGYPYPTSFYNPVPAYPFKVACEKMQQANTGLGALRAAANVYYNYTGQAGNCFDLNSMVIPNSALYFRKRNRFDLLSTIKLTNLKIWSYSKESRRRRMTLEQDVEVSDTDLAWGYQTCTEVYQPMPTDGVTDFEIAYTPNKTEYFAECYKRWGTVPRPDWEEM